MHGDNSELILLIDPDEESLGIIMENTSSAWPVSVKVASSEESVSLLEKEVILVGLGNRIEIWNPDQYENYLIQDPNEYSKMAEKFLTEE